MIGQHHILQRVARLLEEGVLCSPLQSQLAPIAAAALRQAHAMLEHGGRPGKIVLADS